MATLDLDMPGGARRYGDDPTGGHLGVGRLSSKARNWRGGVTMRLNIANGGAGARAGAACRGEGGAVGVGVDSPNRLHRRGFLTTLAGLATSSAGPALASGACGLPTLVTARRIPRIGHLRYGPPEYLADRVEAFRQGL